MTDSIDQERDTFASKLNSITESLLETANAGLKNALGQIDTLRAENARLAEELEKARASLQPAGVAGPEGWRDVIYNTLRNYRMSTLDDGEGGGYPLIDAMSADGQTVAGGIEECDYLADALVDALAAAQSPVSGEQKAVSCASCQDSACDPRFTDLVPCPDCAAKPSVSEFFVDHAILRKAMGMYGISAPESDHELGDRMESYAKKVIKAVVKLPFPAAQDVAGLVEALEQFANDDNWCYDTCNISRDIAKQALSAHRAQQGDQP